MPNERAFPFNEFDRLHPSGFATLGKEKSTTYSNQFYVVATEIGGLYFYILHNNSEEDKTAPAKTEQVNTLKTEDTEEKVTVDDDKAKKEEEAKEKAKKERERKAEIAAQKKAKEKEAAKRAAQKKGEEKKAAELAAQKEAEKKAEEEAAAAEAVETDFANCTELRTVYPHGVPSDHPAYQDKMDRDNDSFACERS